MVAKGVRSLWTVDIRMKLIDQYTVLLHIAYFDLMNGSRRHKFGWARLVCKEWARPMSLYIEHSLTLMNALFDDECFLQSIKDYLI